MTFLPKLCLHWLKQILTLFPQLNNHCAQVWKNQVDRNPIHITENLRNEIEKRIEVPDNDDTVYVKGYDIKVVNGNQVKFWLNLTTKKLQKRISHFL